jgi:hypothetical protein
VVKNVIKIIIKLHLLYYFTLVQILLHYNKVYIYSHDWFEIIINYRNTYNKIIIIR